MIKRAVRSCTLSTKAPVFWSIERTFHPLTSREAMAGLTTRRWCWYLNWFWRQYCNSTHVSEGTIWLSTFCIILTIWMNKQTFFSKFAIGESFAGGNKVMVSTFILIFASRPVLAALQKCPWFLCHTQFIGLSGADLKSFCRP